MGYELLFSGGKTVRLFEVQKNIGFRIKARSFGGKVQVDNCAFYFWKTVVSCNPIKYRKFEILYATSVEPCERNGWHVNCMQIIDRKEGS